METKNIYAYNPKETEQASMFSKLMRNVYRWMTFALAITGLTAACVAGNATLMQFILGNQAVFLGLIIAELVVAFTLIGRVSNCHSPMPLYCLFCIPSLPELLCLPFFWYTK